MVVGTKLEVWNGTADKTSGGLTRDKLMRNPKTNAIVSIAKHESGKRQMARMLASPHGKKFTSNQERVKSGTLRRRRSNRIRSRK